MKLKVCCRGKAKRFVSLLIGKLIKLFASIIHAVVFTFVVMFPSCGEMVREGAKGDQAVLD